MNCHTFETAQAKINSRAAYKLEIVTLAEKAKFRSTFLDVERNVVFESALSTVVACLRKNPNKRFALTKEEAKTLHSDSLEELQAKLDQIAPYPIKLITWGGSWHKPSVFLDIERNVEFIRTFTTVRYHCLRNAGLRYNITKEEAQKDLPSNITILSWSGKYKTPSTFYNKWTDTVFTTPLSTVKEGLIRNNGIDYTPNKSSLEIMVGNFLDSINIDYKNNCKLDGTNYKPDFVIKDHKLIIECDGQFWHSDANQPDKSYHLKKLQAYEAQGYRAVFFRENELRDKLPIVQAILAARLGLAPKYMARKLEHCQGDGSFFETNHLMGKGSGRVYTLTLDGMPKVAMQVKWKDKSASLLEISRFCTDGCSVAGGFSRLLNKIIEEEKPRQVMTFIDKRYGTGHYLPNLGFKHCGEHLSFSWTTRTDVVHRMKFPGNTGYDHGYHKLWDCGQAKWILDIA